MTRRLNQSDLRRLIRHEVKRLNENSDRLDPATEFGDVVSPLVAQFVADHFSDIAERFEVDAPTDLAVPARSEDVAHFSELAADRILADRDLRHTLKMLVSHLMKMYAGL